MFLHDVIGKRQGFYCLLINKVKLYLPIALLGLSNVLCATRSRSVRYGSQTSTEDFLKVF
jgi:hypothetical protein